MKSVWGCDSTPGIVSAWADLDGWRVWRRSPKDGELVLEQARFRPWLRAVIDKICNLMVE
jgi:hypothetical protein